MVFALCSSAPGTPAGATTMEQRALIASALVLGCVTAAGAGGYLAVRQLATPASAESASQVAPGSETPAPALAPAEGTVAEIDSVGESTPAPPPAVPAATREPVTPAPSTTPPTAAVARVERTAPTRPSRTAETARVSPSSSRPAAVPVRRDEPVATPVSTSSGTPRPQPESTATVSASRGDDTGRDSWPARDSSQTADDRWPSRDAGGYGSTTAEASLPSSATVAEPSTPPVPARRLESVTIPADAVIGIQLERGVSTATARVEDPVRARVTRDLIAGGDVVIPAGAKLLGNVTLVEEGGRVKERSRLGIRFHTLVLANGTEIKLPTETVYRDGESPAGKSAAKIGGAAVGGAILGAIMGGGKGAVIGAATGAGSGTGWAMAGDRQPAELRAGQSLTVRVSDSVTTQIER